MPIEFRCTQCQKLLRVPDETAGRQAKCPACETVLTIPSVSSAPPSGGSPPAPPEFNPYQAPAHSSLSEQFVAAGPRRFQPTLINALDVLQRSWDIYKVKMGITMGVTLLAIGLQTAFQFAINPVVMAVQIVTSSEIAGALVQMVLSLVLMVFNLWLNLGQIVALLKIARGEAVEITDIFRGGPYLLRTLGAGMCVVAIVIAVIVPFVIPGGIAMALLGSENVLAVVLLIGGLFLGSLTYLYILLTVSPFMYLIVDRNVGALESLSLARTIVSGNRLHLALVWVLGMLIYFMGLLACCVGAIFTLPLFTMIITVAYLSMTGQPTIDSFARTNEPPIS